MPDTQPSTEARVATRVSPPIHYAWWVDGMSTFPEINPTFERWMADQTFSGLDTPVSSGVKFLMQRAYEAGRQWQADKDATIIDAVNELRKDS